MTFEWFKSIGKVGEDFWVLGSVSSPVFLLKKQDEYILIEGGLALNARLIFTQLKEIVGDLNQVTTWIITHSHFDHCGSLPYLYKRLPNVNLYASPQTIEFFRNEKIRNSIQKQNATVLENLLAPDCMNTLDECLAFHGLMEMKFLDVFSDDAINRLLKLDISCQPIPGHSECMISVWDSRTEILFVSDALGQIIEISKWIPLCFQDYDQYVNSISFLKTINPKYIALGHFGILHHHHLLNEQGINVFDYALGSLHEVEKKILTSIGFETSKEKEIEIGTFLMEFYKEGVCEFLPDIVLKKSMVRLVQIVLAAQETTAK